MISINITTFNSLITSSKIPVSPYGDSTFDFTTKIYNLKYIHNIFEKTLYYLHL